VIEDEIRSTLLGFVGANDNALVAYICLRQKIEEREITFDEATERAREISDWLDRSRE
jgi:hypothetical protein